MIFEQAVSHLQTRLQQPLPGFEAQLRMSPPYRQKLMEEMQPTKTPREAAVCVVLFPKEDRAHTILTVRRADLKDHAGQVSFPGGSLEPDESAEAAAVREVEEEIGVEAHKLRVLGAMTPLYIPPSNFMVYPYIALHPERPQYRQQASEVEHILEVPILHFLSPENRLTEPWERYGMSVQMPIFRVEGHKVWGATAMMLGEFAALFDMD